MKSRTRRHSSRSNQRGHQHPLTNQWEIGGRTAFNLVPEWTPLLWNQNHSGKMPGIRDDAHSQIATNPGS
jgi:hypothetical protein